MQKAKTTIKAGLDTVNPPARPNAKFWKKERDASEKLIQDKVAHLKGYSWAEHEAAKMAYLLLGRERTLEKIATYSGIALSALTKWSKKEGWVAWVYTQEEVQNKLALRGLYDVGVLYLSEKAKAVLGQVIDRGSKLLSKDAVDLKGGDITMSARILLDMAGAMKGDEREKGPDWPEELKKDNSPHKSEDIIVEDAPIT
jgi:hypothetical protein